MKIFLNVIMIYVCKIKYAQKLIYSIGNKNMKTTNECTEPKITINFIQMYFICVIKYIICMPK